MSGTLYTIHSFIHSLIQSEGRSADSTARSIKNTPPRFGSCSAVRQVFDLGQGSPPLKATAAFLEKAPSPDTEGSLHNAQGLWAQHWAHGGVQRVPCPCECCPVCRVWARPCGCRGEGGQNHTGRRGPRTQPAETAAQEADRTWLVETSIQGRPREGPPGAEGLEDTP